MQRLGQSLGGEPPAKPPGVLDRPGLLEARSPLYKSPRGSETMREKRLGAPFPWHFVPTCANSGQMPIKTSLAANGIACQRGGRLLFADLSFTLAAGPRVAGDGAERRRQDEPVAPDRWPLAARRRQLREWRCEPPLPELCHYVGHANGIKSALTLRENVTFWVDFLGGGDADLDDALADVRSCGAEGSAGWTAVGRTEAASLRSLASSPRPARSGCSMSLRSRSMPHPSRCSTRRSRSISRKAASPWSRSHTSLKVKFAQELRAEAGDRPVKEAWALFRRDVAPCLARGRHHRHRARLLPRRRRHHAARPWPRPQSPLAHRARRVVGGAPAREPALRRPHLPQRL